MLISSSTATAEVGQSRGGLSISFESTQALRSISSESCVQRCYAGCIGRGRNCHAPPYGLPRAIDPSVANIFNPPNPQNPSQRAPISVEDVTAYFRMVKDEVGISHEDELVQALIALTSQIHP